MADRGRRKGHHGRRETAAWGLPAGPLGEAGGSARRLGLFLLQLHLVLVPVVFSRDTVEAFEYPKVALLMLAAILLAALGVSALAAALLAEPDAASRLHARARELAREPIALGVLLFCASAALSTATSMSPLTSLRGAHESFAGLTTILSYGVLFFATRELGASESARRRLLFAPMAAAVVVTLYTCAQLAPLDPIAWGRLSIFAGHVRPFGTLGHPNALAAFLAMAFPVAASLAAAAAARRRRFACLAFGVTALLVSTLTVASNSRGGWLALSCALAVLGLGAFGARRRRVALLALGAAPLVAVTLLALSARLTGVGTLESLIERARHLTESASRRELWKAAWLIFLDHPWLGAGLDTFRLAFAPKRSVAYWLSTDWNVTPTKAHDEALQVLSTQGLLGALAIAVLTAGLIAAARRVLRSTAVEERPLLVGTCAGLAAFYAQALVGFTVAASGTLFVTYAALLSGATGREAAAEAPAAELRAAASGTRHRRPALGLLTGGVVSAAVFLHNAGGAAPGALALTLLVLVAVATLSLAASDLDAALGEPSMPGPPALPHVWRRKPRLVLATVHIMAGLLALGLAFFSVMQPARADHACAVGMRRLPSDPRSAIVWHQRAAAFDPLRELHWRKLGIAAHIGAEAASGDERQRRLLVARRAFERAVRLEPADAYGHMLLGRLLADLVREGSAAPREAIAECDQALRMDPNNAYFYSTAANAALAVSDRARAKRYAAMGSALYPQFAGTRYLLGRLSLDEGDLDAAVRELLAAFHGQWYGQEAGRALAATSLSEAYRRLGRLSEAERFGRYAAENAPAPGRPRPRTSPVVAR